MNNKNIIFLALICLALADYSNMTDSDLEMMFDDREKLVKISKLFDNLDISPENLIKLAKELFNELD